MNRFRRSRRRRSGFLTFEWLLLITIVVIGIVSGLAAVRNALIAELEDLAEAVESLYISEDEMEETIVLDELNP